MSGKSRTLRVHANANAKPKKVKKVTRKRVLKLHITHQGVQVELPVSRVPEVDL